MNAEINNGLKAFFVLGVYFFVVEAIGLTHTTFLRMLNILIVGYFVNNIITLRMNEGRNFVSLFVSAFSTNLIAVMLSIISLIGYIYFIQGEEYINTLSKPLLDIGHFKLSLFQFAFAIFAEGFASGIILSFGIMQYRKNKLSSSGI